MWSTITLETKKPLTRQLTDQVRDLIRSGRIPVGERLPSYPEMARAIGLPPSTVNDALRPLVKEGLLERRPRHGTFVRERPRAQKTIGIYYYGGQIGHPEARFGWALHQRLLARIEAAGCQWSMWNDPRPASQSNVPWSNLVRAIEHHDLDALVVPSVDPPHCRWLGELPIPTAFLGGECGMPGMVSMGNGDIGRLGVEELAREGCRTVGLIGATADTATAFTEAVRSAGLGTDKKWILTKGEPPPPLSQAWGYESFKRIWQQPRQPEGLVVAMDAEALGVTMAMLELGVRAPENVRLVYHKNAEVDLFCPFKVAYVVSSATEAAGALIELVERQFRGEKVGSIVLPFRLERAGKG